MNFKPTKTLVQVDSPSHHIQIYMYVWNILLNKNTNAQIRISQLTKRSTRLMHVFVYIYIYFFMRVTYRLRRRIRRNLTFDLNNNVTSHEKFFFFLLIFLTPVA